MTAAIFYDMMAHKVIPAIQKKMGKWANKITIQMDGAKPRTGKDVIQKLKRYHNRTTHFLDFVVQPAQSPDLNTLDLGVFASLAKSLHNTHKNSFDTSLDVIAQQEIQVFEEMDSKVLSRIFDKKTLILRKVIENGGNNMYELPHHRYEK
jgi:hypothetical protein